MLMQRTCQCFDSEHTGGLLVQAGQVQHVVLVFIPMMVPLLGRQLVSWHAGKSPCGNPVKPLVTQSLCQHSSLTLGTVLDCTGVEVRPIGQAARGDADPHRQVQGVLGWCSDGGLGAAAQQTAAAKRREAPHHSSARAPEPAAAA